MTLTVRAERQALLNAEAPRESSLLVGPDMPEPGLRVWCTASIAELVRSATWANLRMIAATAPLSFSGAVWQATKGSRIRTSILLAVMVCSIC
jgi:hypothetical protein